MRIKESRKGSRHVAASIDGDQARLERLQKVQYQRRNSNTRVRTQQNLRLSLGHTDVTDSIVPHDPDVQHACCTPLIHCTCRILYFGCARRLTGDDVVFDRQLPMRKTPLLAYPFFSRT